MRQVRTRVFIQILVPTFVLFLAVVLGGLVYVNRTFRADVVQQKGTELDNAARAIDNWLIARISHMIQLSRTPLVESGERAEVLNYLQQEQERLAFIYNRLIYIRPDGRYWDTNNETGRLENTELVDGFTTGGRLFYYEGPFLDHEHFDQVVIIAAPVITQDRITGVVASTIALETFRRVIGYFTLEEFDSFGLVNPRSVIITDSSGTAAGMTEEERYGNEYSSFARTNGEMVFVSVLRTTWKLVGFVSTSSALSAIQQINSLVLILFVGVVAIIGTVSLAVSAAVVRPIRRLTDGVHRIMEGNYRQSITVNTRDELSELAHAFNKLSERMVKLRTDDQFVFLGHFSARMAHEMRKPLHIAQLAVQAMRNKPQEREKHMETIKQEIANADQFIGEILNFARPEKLDLSRYSLADLVEKTAKKYELVASEVGVALHTDIDHEVGAFYMDVMKMEQVISNLLQNAIDAMSDGQLRTSTEERTISIGLERSGDTIRLRIRDGGPGFDESVIDRVVDPYFTTKTNGTGLGLAISYRILTAHGATLHLRNSADGHGEVEAHFPQ